MTNYQDQPGSPQDPGTGAGSTGYQGGAQPGAYQGGATAQGQYETQQFPPSSAPQWQPGHQGGHQQQSHGMFQGGGGQSRRSVNVRSTFKTTEFWIFIVVSIAMLIAAAVTDQGDDQQGFGTQEAWRYITALAIAYIISRGLTKFGGHEQDDHDHHGH